MAVTESVALQVDQTRLLAPDGTETALLRGATEVAWSPDGRRLAYAISFPADFVHVVDADGANDRVVATGVEPSWSPDGTQLALWDDGWISVLDLATGAEHRLVRARDPRWSPRGDWIAYSTRGGLGVVRPDGSGAHRLTRLSAEYTVYAWSPDGSRLAALFDFRSGRTRLAVVPLLGRTRFAALADELHGVPVWAPDGTTVAADDGNDVRLVNARTLRARVLAPPC